MARVSFTALIEEITGKLSGSVFQDSYGGFQIRTRVSPRNPQTTFQQLRRGEFGYISALWRTLTSVQRQTFIDAAGTPPAALNLFIQSNVNLSLIEQPIISTYVATAAPSSMNIIIDEFTPTTLLIKATGGTTTVPAGCVLLVQMTSLRGTSQIFTNPSMYTPIAAFDEGTILSSNTNILTDWQNRFGIMSIDKRSCLKSAVIKKSNGTRSIENINCINTEAMANKYIPKLQSYVNISTVTTAAESLVIYTMPANTLTANGQRIEWRSMYSFNNAGTTKLLGINFAGLSISGNAYDTLSGGMIEASFIRTSASTARIRLTMWSKGDLTAFNTSDVAGLDFTSSITLKDEVISSAIANIRNTYTTVDLVDI